MDRSPTPAYTLHSPGQVALATFLGGPLGGCVLMAQNYRRVGSWRLARAAIAYGGMSTVALIIVASILPDSFPRLVLPLGYTYALQYAAKTLQGKLYSEHLERSGRKSSWWEASVYGCLCFAVTLVLFALGAMVLPEQTVAG